MTRVVQIAFVAALANFAATSTFAQPQVVDLDYDTTIAHPAYTMRHPAVLFDEAHHNLHTAGGLYKPFADLITHDGYRVESNRKPFTTEVLAPHDILVIANARGALGGGPEAAKPAFSAAECQAVDAWIKAGGSFLFITDHYPYGAAAQPLAKRLGVGMSQGQTRDPQNSIPGSPWNLIFARENDLLGDHPINWGRGPSEQIGRIVTFSGQSLQGPRASVAVLRLADSAMDVSSVDNSLTPAVGRSQGLAFIHGTGRVVVLGEGGALSAQFDQKGEPFGMNVEGTDNRQFALNVMHWLSGLIPINRGGAEKKQGSSRRVPSSRKAKSRNSKPKSVQDNQP